MPNFITKKKKGDYNDKQAKFLYKAGVSPPLR